MKTVFMPAIAPEDWALRPDFKAISISARNLVARDEDGWARARLGAACLGAASLPSWGAAHLADWAGAYRQFGAKPQRTPCSVEALIKRAVRDGTLPSVNPVVDLYNAVSVAHVVPVGGEDADRYAGNARLIRSDGNDVFETTKDGLPCLEKVEPGEVVWRDDVGVTCRRWNWRQSPRTRIDSHTTNAWFVIESLGALPEEALQGAANDLIAGLHHLSPEAEIASSALRAPGD